jgi:hypothetical protein
LGKRSSPVLQRLGFIPQERILLDDICAFYEVAVRLFSAAMKCCHELRHGKDESRQPSRPKYAGIRSVEVNWDYYPNWTGDGRIMAVSADVARMIGVPDGEANP